MLPSVRIYPNTLKRLPSIVAVAMVSNCSCETNEPAAFPAVNKIHPLYTLVVVHLLCGFCLSRRTWRVPGLLGKTVSSLGPRKGTLSVLVPVLWNSLPSEIQMVLVPCWCSVFNENLAAPNKPWARTLTMHWHVGHLVMRLLEEK